MTTVGHSGIITCQGTDDHMRCLLRAAELGVKLARAVSAPNGRAIDAAEVSKLAAEDLTCRMARSLSCAHAPLTPVYECRELRVGGIMVLDFSEREAPNQMEVLKRFQAAGWPRYLVDALGRQIDARYGDKLKKAVFRLNHEQALWLIRFRSHAADRAISWEYRIPLRGT